MISAGLAVEGHAHGGLGLPGHHNPYMTYTEPWRGAAAPTQPPPKPAEFLRPAPKPLARYNGTPSTPSALNGARLAPPTSISRTSIKYPSPPSGINSVNSGPVNLSQSSQPVKEEMVATPINEDISAAAASYSAVYARMYQHQQAVAASPGGFTGLHYQASLTGGIPGVAGVPGPYGTLYPSPYAPMMRTSYVQPPPPLSPLETYSPPSSASATSPGTFVSPPVTFSTPVVKPGQSVLRDKRATATVTSSASQGSFKVPSGKEGSLKHRILTRPAGESIGTHGVISRKRLPGSALSPPTTPTKPTLNTNNNTIPGNFAKGSLIQLATGELRRVEDMRTEDFVHSAEKSPELRLAASTVVKIEEHPGTGTCVITLSYNENRTQVEFEAIFEHPFFVYGQGWASCHPERTLQCYGLKVHRLQVGDILVSLTPREPREVIASTACSSGKSSTITTTATTTAMTARQVSRGSVAMANEHQIRHQLDKTLLPPPAPVPKAPEPLDASNARKRRWSAPDNICDDDQATRRHKE